MISSDFIFGAWLGSSLLIFMFGICLGRRTWLLNGDIIGTIITLTAVTSYNYGPMIAGRTLLVRLV